MSMNSGIYWGDVRHRRFGEPSHEFSYSLYMLGLDLDEVPALLSRGGWFGAHWYNLIRFNQKDYVKSEPGELKQRISSKITKLGGRWSSDNRVTMLAQGRCLGLYFSPINCYFCYDDDGECQYLLAEVSNTPWRERHYYLVPLDGEMKVDKAFHVSPFMGMEMQYLWKVTPPSQRALVHIENHHQGKLFDATLVLKKHPMTGQQWVKTLAIHPMMTLKIVFGIYWQAMKLFIKRAPLHTHPKTQAETNPNKIK